MTIFALFDDIATLLDDVASQSKVAAKNTAQLLGDDIAVNAEQSSGFSAQRELIAIKDIALGAIKNKLILLPIIFGISYVFPVLITVLLILGALYLSYEGAEAIIEMLFKKHEEEKESYTQKIKGAIKTDFVLSIEIIVIALSTVVNEPFVTQVIVISLISLLAVFFVYGLVALIVRIDDLGIYLSNKGYPTIGNKLINSMKYIILSLKYIGIIAMFLVAGGIFSHNIHVIHELLMKIEETSKIGALVVEIGIPVIVGNFIILIMEIFNFFKK